MRRQSDRMGLLAACALVVAMAAASISILACDSSAGRSGSGVVGRESPADLDGVPATDRIAPVPVRSLRYRVVRELPHDPEAFTQGLLWTEEGRLFESTGQRGRSTLREVDLETGQGLRQQRLEDRFFGEGLTRVGSRLIQLTWTSGLALVSDLDSFAEEDRWEYEGQGWGLTFDPVSEKFWMSDGSEFLIERDAQTFDELGRLPVTLGNSVVEGLNELEWIGGRIWANVWTTDRIVGIDPIDGRVVYTIDLHNLLSAEDRTPMTDVLNGIAFRPETGTLLVTGKNWPRLFELGPVVGEEEAWSEAGLGRVD